jgi:hypothetical protein
MWRDGEPSAIDTAIDVRPIFAHMIQAERRIWGTLAAMRDLTAVWHSLRELGPQLVGSLAFPDPKMQNFL